MRPGGVSSGGRGAWVTTVPVGMLATTVTVVWVSWPAMPQFYTQAVSTGAGSSGDGGGGVGEVAASPSLPLLAVAVGGRAVHVYSEQGEAAQAPVPTPADVARLAWQPGVPTVAVGLVDGTVLALKVGEAAKASTSTAAHRASICLMQWSPDGSRLVTGDAAGTIVLWRVDAGGHVAVQHTYRKDAGSPTQLCWLAYPGAAVASLAEGRGAGGVPSGAPSAPPAPSSATGDGSGLTVVTVPPPPVGSTAFLVGTDSGILVYCNDSGACVEVVSNLHSAIDVLQYAPTLGRVILITRSLLLTQLGWSPSDGRLTTHLRAKVAVKGTAGIRGHVWVGGAVMATVTPDEAMARCWDYSSNDTHTIASTTSSRSMPRTERLHALAFSPSTSLLAAGAEGGGLYLWRRHAGAGGSKGAASSAVTSASWEPVFSTTLPAGVASLSFVGRGGVLLVHLANGVVMTVAEAALRRKTAGNVSIIQTSNHTVWVERRCAPGGGGKAEGGGTTQVDLFTLTTGLNLKGVDCTARHVLAWNGKQCEVYAVPDGGKGGGGGGVSSGAPAGTPLKQVAGFLVDALDMAIVGDSVYACSQGSVCVHNLAGTVKHTIPFAEGEGVPHLLDAGPTFLAVATTDGRLRVYDVSRVEPRQVAGGRFDDPSTGVTPGPITSIHVNGDGTRVAILCSRSLTSAATASASTKPATGDSGGVRGATPLTGDTFGLEAATAIPASTASGGGSGAPGQEVLSPDTAVYVYGADSDRVARFDVGPRRMPTFVGWDTQEHRLLAVQVEAMRMAEEDDAGTKAARDGVEGSDGKGDGVDGGAGDREEEPEVEVITLFACANAEGGEGLTQQDAVPLDPPAEALLGVAAPYLNLLLRPDAVPAGSSHVTLRSMRDFVGMEDSDESTRRALMDFSYHMATGNMDEAYKAVKLVANPHIWENMAQMCVKSKRLDVAAVCLGHMGHARGAKAVRDAGMEAELEANVAQVAIQLGMLGDAARLYQSCRRYDKLNTLYQNSGQWDRALAVAARHDRIHLRTTHYTLAEHMEHCGDVAAAIKHYEAAGVHKVEVTRLLHETKDAAGLEAYVNGSGDKELMAWYGQYCEAQGDAATATAYYTKAGDALALVRLACGAGDTVRAVEVVAEYGHPAAAYHLARHLEAKGKVREALTYYEKSGRYNHAVRLARVGGTDADLMSMALCADRDVMAQTAHHFESKGDLERAVQLYHRAGMLTRAVDLCFKAELFADLSAIADELGAKTDPALLHRCAQFFTSHGQHDKAVGMLIQAGQHDHALDVCVAHKVPITEAMAEAMTPPKNDLDDADTKEARTALLMKLAKALKKQGSYHLATKKYTQAGNKVKAMKCLIRSGDTEKIIFFANVSRTAEVYILAANYLQTLPWNKDAEILKAIQDLYTKARAYDHLSTFFEACATLEIDDFRNYEKALAALKEALKHAGKIRTDIRDARITSLNSRIAIVERFVAARKLAKTDMPAMVEACRALLEVRDADTAIRIGDVYALLVYYFVQQHSYAQAHEMVEGMRGRGIPLDPYIEAGVLVEIYKSVGLDPVTEGVLAGEGGDDGIAEEIEEEVGGEEVYGAATAAKAAAGGAGRAR